jgi:hypothetical protein
MENDATVALVRRSLVRACVVCLATSYVFTTLGVFAFEIMQKGLPATLASLPSYTQFAPPLVMILLAPIAFVAVPSLIPVIGGGILLEVLYRSLSSAEKASRLLPALGVLLGAVLAFFTFFAAGCLILIPFPVLLVNGPLEMLVFAELASVCGAASGALVARDIVQRAARAMTQ